jgi:hypothetical protein
MFSNGCNEVVNQNSRYEQLLRGEIGGEDIKLIFVDNSADNIQKSSGGRWRLVLYCHQKRTTT